MNKNQTKVLLLIGTFIIWIVMISGCISNEEKQTNGQTTTKGDYFPLLIGNSWSYDLNIETGETNVQKTMDVQISKKEKIGGVGTYAMEYKLEGKVLQTEFYTNENEKVICYKRILIGTNFDINPPQLLYDFSSLKKGEKWEWRGKVGYQEASLKGEVLGEETITVPGGTFKTYKVKVIIRDDGGRILVSTDRWFAQGIGMIKEESIDNLIHVTAELKEYEIKI